MENQVATIINKDEVRIPAKMYLLFAIFFLMVSSAFAQNIKEVDGVFYSDTTLYSGNYTIYHENVSQKIEMRLLNGLKEGAAIVYFDDGKLNEIRSYKKNRMDGTWLTFNENKVRVAEARYKEGKKDGKWFIWDDNGTLIYEIEYTDGEKTGSWKSYDNKGVLIGERYYPSILKD